MFRFIESICCLDGEAKLVNLHQDRVNRTFKNFFPENIPLELSRLLTNVPESGKFKCRIEYGVDSYVIEYLAYQNPKIDSVKMVRDNTISYPYKFAKRQQLAGIFDQKGAADDIIIVKNDLITDSYYANLAFFDGKVWWTPAQPLLPGVKRASLLANGRINLKDIHRDEFNKFEKVSLINAMLDLGEVEIDI